MLRNTAAWACNTTREKAKWKKTTFWRLCSSAQGLSKSICYSVSSSTWAQANTVSRAQAKTQFTGSLLTASSEILKISWGHFHLLTLEVQPRLQEKKHSFLTKTHRQTLLIPVYSVKLTFNFSYTFPNQTADTLFPFYQISPFSDSYLSYWGFPGGSEGKVSACNAGDPGLIPGSGRSSGEGRPKSTTSFGYCHWDVCVLVVWLYL